MLKSCGKSFRSALLSASIISTQKEEEEKWYKEGWKRVKEMYKIKTYENISPQYTIILNTCFTSFLIGFLSAGLPASRNAFNKFTEENQAAIYHNHVDVKQRLQKTVLESLFRNGFRFAWRVSLLSTGVVATIFTMNAFIGKSTLFDFLIGGSALGAALRYKHGKSAMYTSAAMGGCLSGAFGLVILHIMRESGSSFNSIFTNLSLAEDHISTGGDEGKK